MMPADLPHQKVATPLLHPPEYRDFPTDGELYSLYTKVCGGNHSTHKRRNGELCYLFYLSKCKSNSCLTRIPGTNISPLPCELLVNSVPFIDTFSACLEKQSKCHAGGSYSLFLKDTVDLIKSNRQISESSLPTVRTIVFGISPIEEVKSFVKAFNELVDKNATPTFGSMVLPFYHFNVVYCRSKQNFHPRLVSRLGNLTGSYIIGSPMEDIPARITLGLWNHRFDIIFNFKYSDMYYPTLEADYQLVMQKTVLEDIWLKLFSMLHGYAVGIDIESTVEKLSSFIACCFRFKNLSGPVPLKLVDLNVLLVFSGWNHPVVNATSLQFFTTGALLVRPWQLRYGLGRWSEPNLPLSLDVYLQSESIAIMNAVALYSMLWLVHWFPTPGIAALTSRKDPLRFFRWFSNFQIAVLKGAVLPKHALFNEKGCRILDPSEMISCISYKSGSSALFLPSDLAACLPPWGSITSAGCKTDLEAIDHILKKIRPIVNASGVPGHLRLESDPEMISRALTGENQLSGKFSQRKKAPGCRFAKEVKFLPDIMSDLVEENFNTTVSRAYTLYAENVASDYSFSNYSPEEFSLLFAWTHPTKFVKLYMKSFLENCAVEYFCVKELLFLKPLASAFLSLPLDDPPKLAEFNKKRYDRKDLKRFRISKKLMSSSSIQVQRKAALTMSLLSRKMNTTKSVLNHLSTLLSDDQQFEKKDNPPFTQIAVDNQDQGEDLYSPTHPTEDGEVDDILLEGEKSKFRIVAHLKNLFQSYCYPQFIPSEIRHIMIVMHFRVKLWFYHSCFDICLSKYFFC